MQEHYTHLIATRKEKETAEADIREYLIRAGHEGGFWFDRSADAEEEQADQCFLSHSFDFTNLGRVNPERDVCILLSVYDLDLVRLLYQYEIKNVLCLIEPGLWIGPEEREKAGELEQKYLSEKNYPSLKKLNRINMIFSYLLRETAMRAYPIQLQIETTSFCNAQCIMCGHYIYQNAIAKHMDRMLLEAMDDSLKYAEQVILHGNGEPFLQPEIEALLKKYQTYGIKVATNTNLSVLPQTILQMIPDMFSEITVSIDGCTKEIYEGIRKGLSFEKLLSNLNRLKSTAPDLPKKLAMVIMRQNLDQVPEMVQFARDYGFSTVNYIAMGSSPFAENQKDEVWNYPNVLRQQLKAAAEKAATLGMNCEMPLSAQELLSPLKSKAISAEWEAIQKTPFFPDEKEQKKRFEMHVAPRLRELKANGIHENYSRYTTFPLQEGEIVPSAGKWHYSGCCDSILMRPFINLDGRMFACCIHTKHYIGEMSDADSLRRIWNSEGFRALRSLFYQGKLPAYCEHCSFMDNQFLALVRGKNEEDI